jgi:integrase/recombinase XerC
MSTLTWDVAVRDYLASLRAAGRRPLTVRLHQHYLNHLRRFAPGPQQLTIQALERALSARRDWQPETIRSATGVYRGFTRWLHGRGHLAVDPGRMLPAVRVPAGVARPMPDELLVRLLAGLPPGRDRWLVLLGSHAGLRAAEIAAVSRRDLDGDLLYVVGKGGKQRVVPLVDEDLVAAIRQSSPWLFPGRTDGHLSPGHVSVLLSRLLPDHWTAHTLRHRAGTAAYAGTRDILAVGRFLGHAKPETTQRYVQLPPDALRAVARAAA